MKRHRLKGLPSIVGMDMIRLDGNQDKALNDALNISVLQFVCDFLNHVDG